MEFLAIVKRYLNSSGASLPLKDYAIFICTLENGVEIADPISIQIAESQDSMLFGQFLSEDLSRITAVQTFLDDRKQVAAFRKVLEDFCAAQGEA